MPTCYRQESSQRYKWWLLYNTSDLSPHIQSKPTYDEEEVIAKLNQAISRYLVCVNYFDVLDELDDDEDSEDTDCKSHFQRGENTFHIALPVILHVYTPQNLILMA